MPFLRLPASCVVVLLFVDDCQCETNVTSSDVTVEEGDFVEINCSVTYNGNLRPTFLCNDASTVDADTARNDSLFFYQTFTYRAYQNTTISCRLHFNQTEKEINHIVARTFNFTWSPSLRVACKLISIQNESSVCKNHKPKYSN